MRSPLIGFSITRGCLTASAGLTRKTPHPDPPPQGGREMPEPDPPPQGGREMPEPDPPRPGGGGVLQAQPSAPWGDPTTRGTAGPPPPPARCAVRPASSGAG